jgi:superfamily II DNA or RNA helicase
MSHTDKHVPKINVFESVKSQSERKWPVNFCLSVISVSMSDKGTDVPAATCLFIVTAGHCSLNRAT